MIYELREYVAHDGAVEQVHDRFRDATLPLFERHGLEVVGFWTDRDEPRRIVYLLQFDDADAQSRAWAGFQDDPEWKQAKTASEADGPIVESMTSRTLEPVAYWPTTSGEATS
jgi:hypothetical protein